MMAKDQPTIMVRKEGGKLSALTAIDAELLDGCDPGQMFRLEPATRRSNPQNSLYWVMLKRVCEATGKWPTSHVLHKELLRVCGFVTPVFSLDGGSMRLEANSAAFTAMKSAEFNAYFQQATAKLAETLGFDPLEFYQGDAA